MLRFLIHQVLPATGVLVLCAQPVQAAIIHSQIPDANYLAHAQSARFASIGAMQIDVGSEEVFASGVLIDPLHVLMTAHQVAGTDGFGAGIDEIRYYTGPDANSFETLTLGTEVIRHPDWDPGQNAFNQVDLAILRLEQPLLSVAPAARYRGVDRSGAVIDYAGYGMIGDATTGPLTRDNLRRGWQNELIGLGGDPGLEYAAPWHAVANLDFLPALPLEASGAPGDSGGGGFTLVNGEWQLALINDSVTGFGYGADFLGTRVSLFNDWIDSVVPEPGTLAMAAIAVLLVVRRRPTSITHVPTKVG